MVTVKITSIGNSLGVILPKEVLAKLKVGKGDALYLTDTPYGVELGAVDPSLEAELASAEKVMRDYRDVLKKLAE